LQGIEYFLGKKETENAVRVLNYMLSNLGWQTERRGKRVGKFGTQTNVRKGRKRNGKIDTKLLRQKINTRKLWRGKKKGMLRQKCR
jgi:hypothetical protein